MSSTHTTPEPAPVAAKIGGVDSHGRALAKAVSWRAVGTLDTFILSMIFTGNAKFAVTIATAEALTKIALYYVHERVWRKVRWGRLEAAPAA